MKSKNNLLFQNQLALIHPNLTQSTLRWKGLKLSFNSLKRVNIFCSSSALWYIHSFAQKCLLIGTIFQVSDVAHVPLVFIVVFLCFVFCFIYWFIGSACAEYNEAIESIRSTVISCKNCPDYYKSTEQYKCKFTLMIYWFSFL